MRLVKPTCGIAVPNIDLIARAGQLVRLTAPGGIVGVFADPRATPPHTQPIAGWGHIPGALSPAPNNRGFIMIFNKLRAACNFSGRNPACLARATVRF